MPVTLNHTIVQARDAQATAWHFTEILGLPDATRFAHFLVVELANGVSLDITGPVDAPPHQHYAFLVSETEFDQIFGRIRDRGLTWWAGPGHRQEGRINHNDGGRGVYWDNPDGHSLEILTVPYGGWGDREPVAVRTPGA